MTHASGSRSGAGVDELVRLNLEFGEQEKLGAEAVEWFRRALADDVCFRRANGSVVDKAAFLAGLSDPGNATDELATEVVQADVIGPLAVADVRVTFSGMRGGKPAAGTFRNIRLFERSDDRWVCFVWFNRRESADPR